MPSGRSPEREVKVVFKRHFFLIAAICVVLAMGLAAAAKVMAPKESEGGGGPGGPGGPGGRAATVAVYTVAERPFTDSVEVLGVAKGRQSVTITSNTSELVKRVMFRDGQAVPQGAALVELTANEEDAGVLQARANLALAQRSYQRWKTLADQGIASQARLDQEKATLEAAQASLAAAQARRGDRLIRAPFSGVVGLTDVTPGTLISPGAPIVTLDDVSVVRVDFEIPERYLSSIAEGAEITATADAYGDAPFQGRIAQLNTRVNTATRAITARAEFPNVGGRLKPGMLMKVRVERGGRSAMAVPESAVQFEGDSASVFRIAAQGERQIAQRVTVIVGAREGGMVEIRDGLNAGDRLVADGLNRVQPNQPVRVAGAGRPAGAAGAPKDRAP